MSEWWLIAFLLIFTVFATSLILYPLRRHRVTCALLIPAILIGVGVAYFYWGGFPEWQQYAQQKEHQEQAQQLMKTIKTPQELIDKLRAKLDDTPNSAKGWYLLGRLYSNQNDQKNAAASFAKAYRFQPDNEQYAVNYAHSLWELNHQQFNLEITDIFNKLLKTNPNQPDALAMMAMDAFLSHAYNDAIDYWQRLLKIAPPQSEEADAIRKAIAKAQEELSLKDSEVE